MPFAMKMSAMKENENSTSDSHTRRKRASASSQEQDQDARSERFMDDLNIDDLNEIEKELDNETAGTAVVTAYLQKAEKSKRNIPLVTPEGAMTEFTIKRMFSWMVKIHQQQKEMMNEVKDLRRVVSKSSDVAHGESVVPGVKLPCDTPNDLKNLDLKLSEEENNKESLILYLSRKATYCTENPWDIAENILKNLMKPYCGCHVVYDGKHSTNGKLSMQSDFKLVHSVLEAVLDQTIVRDSQKNVVISRKEIKGKMVRWLTTCKARLQPGGLIVKIPWVFQSSEAEIMQDEN